MMATLYEIDTQIQSCVDGETGEVIDPEKLTALVMQRERKLEGVALWVKNLTAHVDDLKVEEDAFKARRQSAERKVQSLKAWLSSALSAQPFETVRVKISFRRSVTADVNEDDVPKKWCTRTVVYKPDKKAIKDALCPCPDGANRCYFKCQIFTIARPATIK